MHNTPMHEFHCFDSRRALMQCSKHSIDSTIRDTFIWMTTMTTSDPIYTFWFISWALAKTFTSIHCFTNFCLHDNNSIWLITTRNRYQRLNKQGTTYYLDYQNMVCKRKAFISPLLISLSVRDDCLVLVCNWHQEQWIAFVLLCDTCVYHDEIGQVYV